MRCLRTRGLVYYEEISSLLHLRPMIPDGDVTGDVISIFKHTRFDIVIFVAMCHVPRVVLLWRGELYASQF